MKHYAQNRKARLAAGVTAAALAFGAATPAALAQAETGDEVFMGDASQTQAAAVQQTNAGDANAAADDRGVAYASVDQDLEVEQRQYNGGFGDPFEETGIFEDDDADDDGVLDGRDAVILAGDHDNDGFVDAHE